VSLRVYIPIELPVTSKSTDKGDKKTPKELQNPEEFDLEQEDE